MRLWRKATYSLTISTSSGDAGSISGHPKPEAASHSHFYFTFFVGLPIFYNLPFDTRAAADSASVSFAFIF